MKSGPKRVALYCRVSTSDQSTAMQENDLRRYADARGFTIYKVYTDHGVSGAKDRRPALDALMNDARKRLFDVVLVWRFDRFARSTIHLLKALKEFRCLGVDFISYNENIDTSTPIGEAMFTIVAAMAELERMLIKERVTAGVRQAIKTRAKAGKTWGRVKTEHGDPQKAAEIFRLRREGLSYHAIAKQVGVSSRTVWRLLQRETGEASALSV
ncbi:MAG: recombinase family protein [Nitrospira sp.]|nr:recombinase family protein [Nitrospira sp.]